MNRIAKFELYRWIEDQKDDVSISLAGSAASPLSLKEIEEISTNAAVTARACNIRDLTLGLGTVLGFEPLRKRVAAFYTKSEFAITAEHVIIANATTGANLIVQEALISSKDHAICMYPVYNPLFAIPAALGAQISYWRLDPKNGWKASLEELKKLIKSSTKLLIVNNPHNPTGSVLSTSDQIEIVKVAKEHNIVIMADEIFRPLFHTDETPASFVEHSHVYDRIVVTGSLSKAWGLSGVRIGWAVTKNKELRNAFLNMREYTLTSTSTIDDVLATEVLSERCRDQIIARNLGIARKNLGLLEALAAKHSDIVSFAKPPGGATAFVQFRNRTSGFPLDDVLFCRALMEKADVLLSPGSLCFGPVAEHDFRGFTRIHLTAPNEMFITGIQKIDDFLRSESYDHLA